MTPKATARPKGAGTVKTTLELPEPLWREAKIRAMDERSDLRSVVIEALESFLKKKPGR